MQPSPLPPNADPSTPPSPPGWRVFIASCLGHPYVSVILCAAALIWTVSTLADVRSRFDEFGFNGDQNDFVCYYVWAQAMRENLNPYTADLRDVALRAGVAMGRHSRADYPPTFVLSVEPLTLLNFRTAYWLWVGLNAAALALALFLVLGKDSGLSATTALTLAALALFYKPIFGDLYWGQPHTILLAMMVMASRWFRQGKDAGGGFILAFAGLLKIYPLFLVGYLLVTRRWRAVFFTALGLAIGAVATIAVVGISRSVAFGGRLTFIASGQFLAVTHSTASGKLIDVGALVSRWFWQLTGSDTGSAIDWMRRLLVALAQMTLLGLTAYATLVGRAGRGYEQRAAALWVVTAALLAPTAWVHYMILLVFPLAVLAAAAVRGQASSLAISLGVASFLLTQFAAIFDVLGPFLPPWLTHGLSENYAALMTLLVYASAWRLTTEQT